MRYEIIGKNGYVPTKQVETYVKKRLEKVVSFFNPQWVIGVRVVLKEYKDHSKVEVTIPCKGITLRSEVSDSDIYRAIDKTNDKLVAQVRKYKDKLSNHLAKKGIKDIYSKEFSEATDQITKEVLAGQLVKSKSLELSPMSVDQALIEMEMMDHDFFIFLNEATNKVSVVYLREDGDYAVIETSQ
ncbi:MAG: ribosome-associated translation inhibitor RaiA [Acholeplasmataceae bacterium]|jgi:putative sigma-54 modulation protein|nr:ribosome-associated translation inhibitor RaiA [Acholeplasmataceae bacterium]MDD4203923.1 ribosome-associated translation inhibitor RaiA [Acholeplasmataceae bacterium]MDD4468551.1 ribosome-associated translation inhibitor RaiA [Acholeplasmataceae bacterium]MDD4824557.1 ribosome-associated translation inhibitor RaiA [Acholeplasmataceae bacterium]